MVDLVDRVLSDLDYYFPADHEDPGVMYLARGIEETDEDIAGVTGSGPAVVAKLVRAGMIDRDHVREQVSDMVVAATTGGSMYSPPGGMPYEVLDIYDAMENNPQDLVRPMLRELVDYYLAPDNQAVWVRRITVM
jgi:hypothetical protein